jgi:hypothetical protein
MSTVTAVGLGAQLAARLERGAQALLMFASGVSDDEWRTPIPGDGRPVGVVVHHVASVYPIEVDLARRVAAGEPIRGVTMADIHEMNARHASEHANAGRDETLALLASNAAAAAEAIRTMSDAELATAAPVSLYADAELTSQFVLEDHAVRHSLHHLARIRAALGR